MNYRLGPLGWLTLGLPTNFTGNYGVLDILLALKWIQENIVSFGGNNKTVLLFGQSTGGFLAHIISTLPQANTLFSSVISKSGSGRYLTTTEQQITNVDQINQATIINASIYLYLPTNFYAHVDRNIIPVQPIYTSPKVPFMAGTCTMDGTFFAWSSFSNPLGVTSNDYNTYLSTVFGANLVSNISSVYPISMFNSTSVSALYAIAAVITDAEYACPTRRALKTSLTTNLGTYTYLWNHTSSCPWVSSIKAAALAALGPTHTSELAFVFGEISNLPQPNGTCTLSANEQILSVEMITAWQSMSKNGYPTLANGTKWIDWSNGEQGVRFDHNLTFNIINTTQCDFWDSIQTFMTTTTTTTTTPASGVKSYHGIIISGFHLTFAITYIGQCPVEPMVITYMIVHASIHLLLILLALIGVMNIRRNFPHGIEVNKSMETVILVITFISTFIVLLFSFAWLIADSVWVYGAKVNNVQGDYPSITKTYCRSDLYKPAFILLTINYIDLLQKKPTNLGDA
ncbi:unnamed protein product [Adineta steineri]|uniref:Carboxylic ester hydrolase n=1 Tax=Adineta steineri TaxID=433720 RepID=A0A813QJ31_9BILA|nr:unnamed protein product [Adineta steineri]CAF0768215.1 unnamed protein product [Adineta steineri]